VRLRKLLSCLEVVREQAKQRTFRPRQHAVLETLYQGMLGWRPARLCRLLRLFGDPTERAGRKDGENEEHRKLAAGGGAIEEAGEAEYEELLRLLEEEMAQVREEFEYVEKVNEEIAAIERDAALAPEGEAWTTLARQQAALDRPIDRKVRILLALQKELTGLRLAAPPSVTRYEREMEKIEKLLGIKAPSWPGIDQGAAGTTRMEEQSRNVYENKGPLWKTWERSWNVVENKGITSQGREYC
jgi:hypothetical protein